MPAPVGPTIKPTAILAGRIDVPEEASPYPFLAAIGDGVHQIAVGPVHAGIIEPGHFRFSASGETVVRLEQRLGDTHALSQIARVQPDELSQRLCLAP